MQASEVHQAKAKDGKSYKTDLTASDKLSTVSVQGSVEQKAVPTNIQSFLLKSLLHMQHGKAAC